MRKQFMMGDILYSIPIWQGLSQKKIPLILALKVSNLLKELDKTLSFYKEEYAKISTKNLSDSLEENKNNLESELQELYSFIIELDIPDITLNELAPYLEVTPVEAISINNFLIGEN